MNSYEVFIKSQTKTENVRFSEQMPPLDQYDRIEGEEDDRSICGDSAGERRGRDAAAQRQPE